MTILLDLLNTFAIDGFSNGGKSNDDSIDGLVPN